MNPACYLKHSLIFCSLMLLSASLAAQSTKWAFSAGSSTDDGGVAVCIGHNGNVYVSGTFTGTMDIDPSAAVYNLSSHGGSDIFVACYTPNGVLLWAFNVGGASDDGIENMCLDRADNVIIVGYFRGLHTIFDPSPGGTAFLTEHGGGDGFVARYSSAGVYAWAIDLGGPNYTCDYTESAATDSSGNVYVGGVFHDSMDIDPSAAVYTLSSLKGTAYLVKYTGAGQLAWGFAFGGAGVGGLDNAVWGMKVDNGYVYTTGAFHGINSDFDPSPATAYLSSFGSYDAFLAKYDTSGNYVFAIDIGGNGDDEATDIALDSAKNIYLSGSSSSISLQFGPAAAATIVAPGGGGNQDIFLARYSSTGQYIWSRMLGGPDDETGYGIAIAHQNLYFTGYFHDSVDFDPSPAIARLFCNGGTDIYFARFNLDGNYLCAFNIGGKGVDIGSKLATDTAGYLYGTGQFSLTNIDFNPQPPAYDLNSDGGRDVFVDKIDWRSSPLPAKGYLTGDTICSGAPAYLTFHATAGFAPYTVIYTDGLNTYTATNVQSGQPFILSPSPTGTTTYQMSILQGDGLCVPVAHPDTSATIVVNPRPRAMVSGDTQLCPGRQCTLQASGGITYSWYPAIDLDSTTIASPLATVTDSVTYHVAVGNAFGCHDTAQVTVSVIPTHFAVGAAFPHLCKGDTLQLSATGGNTYAWSPADSISDTTIANPLVWPQGNKVYLVSITENTCGRSAALAVAVNVLPLPDVKIAQALDVDCGHKQGMLSATGAISYRWLPPVGLADPASATTNAGPQLTTLYTVIGTDSMGCSNKDSATIHVYDKGTGRLFVPNAFTPNNDGRNDCFRVIIPGAVSAYEFMVYDRWGNKVFYSQDNETCWDGRCNGVPVQLDTYFYYYKGISSTCGSIAGKGDVELIR